MKLLILSVLLLSVTFFSCDKCYQCHIEKNGQPEEIGELCGEDHEDTEAYGYYDTESDSLYEIHCEEH